MKAVHKSLATLTSLALFSSNVAIAKEASIRAPAKIKAPAKTQSKAPAVVAPVNASKSPVIALTKAVKNTIKAPVKAPVPFNALSTTYAPDATQPPNHPPYAPGATRPPNHITTTYTPDNSQQEYNWAAF